MTSPAISPAALAPAPAGPAPFACQPEASRGRLYPEPGPDGRSEFQRDRDRIVHSSAFRRLQYKTQVFVYHEGDHYRTRLTHSLEVAQIARSVARALGLNEDLAEALALAHDLGHTPFGHAGEEALNEVMGPYGGFDHNEQTLRILTSLERRYLAFDGLNLTWEAVEGVVKHNGPVHAPPPSIAAYAARQDLWLDSYAGAEAQIAALSDDIAYNNHDIDDGLRAGLFAMADLAAVPLVGPVMARLLAEHGEAEPSRLAHELVRRLINIMVGDLLAETRQRIQRLQPRSADEVRRLGRPLAGFSEAMQANDRALKSFLFEHMYRHYKVNRMTAKARIVVQDLFRLYMAEPERLPAEWQRQLAGRDPAGTARLVADYIAGMTDRFALNEHHRLFESDPQS
jgi:dGTPase